MRKEKINSDAWLFNRLSEIEVYLSGNRSMNRDVYEELKRAREAKMVLLANRVESCFIVGVLNIIATLILIVVVALGK